ncbi:MAG: M48 family metallopeptidase [Planctomycetaceae bacterium]|nr:M48 family metallopeptidase [Planctomycetaceae bacterium]
MSTDTHSEFPQLKVNGDTIEIKDCIEAGTGSAKTLATLAGCLGLLALALGTMGIGLIALIIGPIVDHFTQKRALALIHGSGLKVGSEQFPEIHECVVTFCERLGLMNRPDVYIVEAEVMNAAAVKFGGRSVVLLTDDLIHGCLCSSNPNTLAFVLGHELAHIAAGHTGMVRAGMRQYYKKLSRLDEMTADRVGTRLVGSRKVAAEGLVLLTVGPHLLQFVNPKALQQQVREVASNKQSAKAERKLTHPLLLNRVERVMREQV